MSSGSPTRSRWCSSECSSRAASCCWPARGCAADADGVEVRNAGWPRYLPWELVRAVSFPDGASWARLDLPDYEYVPVLAVQAVDGMRAVEAIRGLRALHAARASVPTATDRRREAATRGPRRRPATTAPVRAARSIGPCSALG